MEHTSSSIPNVRWQPFDQDAEMIKVAAHNILNLAQKAISEQGRFTLVLAGGNTPRALYILFREANADWAKWHIYWGDERCLNIDDPERNSRMANEAWLHHVPIPRTQIHPIPGELGAEIAAITYAKTLRGLSDFDCVLLGLGEDAHTASLFPHNQWGHHPESPDVIPVFNAPKAPPERVSMTAKRLSQAKSVILLVSGASKQEALIRWKAGELVPIASICPKNGLDVMLTASAIK